jgi:hypothetical protein
MNLADDLQQWLAYGTVAPEVLPQVSWELREIADALDTGASIPQVPGIPVPRRKTHVAPPRRDVDADTFDDDIPFRSRNTSCARRPPGRVPRTRVSGRVTA